MQHTTLPHNHHKESLNVVSHLPQDQDFETLANLFKLLGDDNRLKLFWILCHCEECLVDLAAMMDMSSPALSHHLKQLRDGGLVVSRRAGKEVYYRAASTAPVELLHHFMEQLNHVVCPVCSAEKAAPVSETMRAVHDLLVSDLSKRHTIDALSKQFFMDSSTLKREFRNAYGLPIATYLKEYRLKRAMQLLCDTDLPIRDIALQIGYETQSKFTAAFKTATKLSPSQYRQACRK